MFNNSLPQTTWGRVNPESSICALLELLLGRILEILSFEGVGNEYTMTSLAELVCEMLAFPRKAHTKIAASPL